MNGTIRVGSLFGIPFYVAPSWFLVLGLVTWSYGSGIAAQFPELSGSITLLLGFTAALLLFASVLAHELGHSVVALRQGVEVKSITLFLFGGLAALDKESKTPAEAVWVAIAGPIVSLLLFGLFTLLGVGTAATGPLGAILGLVASVNLILALFNLIPGLPLDGGNVLKAIVWKITGNPYKGVVFASRVGQIIGGLAVASGLLPILLYGSFGGFWNLLVGWFLLQNAGRSAQFAKVQEKLVGLTAGDAVPSSNPVVLADLSLREFANEFIIGKGEWRKFFVTNAKGQLVGMISVDDLKAIPSSRWPETQVKELMQPVEQATTVQSSQSLLEVVTLLEERRLTQLPVVRDNGVLVGLLEKTAIIRLLQKQVQANPA